MPTSFELPFRQVHLDFHTSPFIPEVGRDFDPDEFADTLKRAHVNSINLFARCHHGYVYYDTKAFPERRHPHETRRNLLGDQIAACHRRGIKAPVYVTVMWDKFTAEAHPEWAVCDEKGNPVGTPPLEAGFYRSLCLNTPYVDFLRELTREILTTLPVDGFWYDIVWPVACACRWCRAGMEAAGLDPADAAARQRYGFDVYNRFTREMSEFVRGLNPDALLFYNRGHVNPAVRPALGAFTHLELESLPSGGWGYLHFPWTMRYARSLGLDALGMTGKFHRSWGDFHSFKNPAALQFECFQMLALNGKCCVGDQLHPRGRICPTTYGLIGSVYAEVERKEPWCRAAEPVVDLAILNPEELGSDTGHTAMPKSGMAATRLLQEGRHQFDVIDSQADLARYRLVIVPDEYTVGPALARRLDAYVAAGGALLATHRGGLKPDGSGFALRCLGIAAAGEAPFSPDFIVPGPELGAGLAPTEYVMDLKALAVRPGRGAQVLAWANVPYFNRGGKFFCSHRHTPSAGRRGYPAAVQKGRALYFAHPLFATYQRWAPQWVKTLFLNAVARLLPEPLVRADGPSSLMVTLNRQPAEKRLVVHLLHYIPERRCDELDVIEDIIPLRDVTVSLRGDLWRGLPRVVLAPEGTVLPVRRRAGRLEFAVPCVRGHQMVALG
jgi:hypothetical protein